MLKKLFHQKGYSAFTPVVFILLIIALLIITSSFSDYKLKTNLLAFQKREMKSSVENFILIIDSMRNNCLLCFSYSFCYCTYSLYLHAHLMSLSFQKVTH
ncbi:MAG TPA: hypothetical protein DC014_03815 [Treponema sp.]|nr:hypothetical protein [Treponema sp.]